MTTGPNTNRRPLLTAPFCPGCGTYYAAHRRHRDDCTAHRPRGGVR